MRIDSDYPFIAGIEGGVSMERLKKEKMVRLATPPFHWDPFLGLDFSTPSGRLEFYCERLLPTGHQIAMYTEPMEVPTEASKAEGKNEEYPYQFFSGRQRFFMQSLYTDDPVMVKLSGGKPSASTRLMPRARVSRMATRWKSTTSAVT